MPRLVRYHRRYAPGFHPDTVAELRRIGPTELARRTGLSARRIADILADRVKPRTKTITVLKEAVNQPT